VQNAALLAGKLLTRGPLMYTTYVVVHVVEEVSVVVADWTLTTDARKTTSLIPAALAAILGVDEQRV